MKERGCEEKLVSFDTLSLDSSLSTEMAMEKLPMGSWSVADLSHTC